MKIQINSRISGQKNHFLGKIKTFYVKISLKNVFFKVKKMMRLFFLIEQSQKLIVRIKNS